MAVERFTNNYTTTLNGGIDDTVTTLTLTSATGAPVAPFRILIDSEIIYVGARSGTSCTSCTRGAESTTGAAHSNAAAITHIFTAGAISAVKADLLQSGTYANLPASGIDTGETYYFTDSLYDKARWNGSSWVHFIGGNSVTPPVSADYAWVNQGSATVTTTYGGVVLYAPSSASNSLRVRVKTIPAAPYTAIMALVGSAGSAASAHGGIALRDSAGGGIVLLEYRFSDESFFTEKYTNATTYSATYGSTAMRVTGPVRWLRIVDDNTNRKTSVSVDGTNWMQIHTVGRTDFITPDQIGYYLNVANSVEAYMNVISFSAA